MHCTLILVKLAQRKTVPDTCKGPLQNLTSSLTVYNFFPDFRCFEK